MSREGGRSGRTHLMVGATGLSMAETLTVAAMHNAVDSPPKELVKHAPAQQPQNCCELEQQ